MLSARSVLGLFFTLTIFSLVVVFFQMLMPPDSNGLGHDSYGIRQNGMRGLYETLEALDLPVQRGLVPPPPPGVHDGCLAIWNPAMALIAHEPAYIRDVVSWLRRGGNGLVAFSGTDEFMGMRHHRQFMQIWEDTPNLDEAFGLPFLRLTRVHLASDEELQTNKPVPKKGFFSEAMDKLAPKTSFTPVARDVVFDGDWAHLGSHIHKLLLPGKRLQAILPMKGYEPIARLTCVDRDQNPVVIAAMFQVGNGHLTVLGDGAIWNNAMLAGEDNAILAVHLLSPDGRKVTFDEFYHGLTIRGNPVWLLTLPRFAVLFCMFLIATVAWAWRASMRLGPPLKPHPVSRRNLREYVESISVLFRRNRCNLFLLQEIRDGVLWRLRHRLCLPPSMENESALTAVLSRKSPVAAEHFVQSMQAAERLLSGSRTPTEYDIVKVVKELSLCQSPDFINRSKHSSTK